MKTKINFLIDSKQYAPNTKLIFSCTRTEWRKFSFFWVSTLWTTPNRCHRHLLKRSKYWNLKLIRTVKIIESKPSVAGEHNSVYFKRFSFIKIKRRSFWSVHLNILGGKHFFRQIGLHTINFPKKLTFLMQSTNFDQILFFTDSRSIGTRTIYCELFKLNVSKYLNMYFYTFSENRKRRKIETTNKIL